MVVGEQDAQVGFKGTGKKKTELLRYFEIGRRRYVSRSGRLGEWLLLPDCDAESVVMETNWQEIGMDNFRNYANSSMMV